MGHKVHTFTLERNEDLGILGWVCDRKPYFDPMPGQGVAHDVFEEFPNGGEQPHDELLAMGSMMFGRGSYEHLFGMYGLAASIAAEFHEMLRHVFHENTYFLKPAPNTRKLNDDYEHQEYIISEFMGIVEKEVREWDEYEPSQISSILDYLPHAANWLRIGFRGALKRYAPDLDGCDVANMFESLKEQVDRITQWAEEGDKLRVIFSKKRSAVEAYHEPWY